jgi:hypothetical protein
VKKKRKKTRVNISVLPKAAINRGEPNIPLPPRQSWLHSAQNHPNWIAVSLVIVLLGLISALVTIFRGPLWPIDPDIQFRDTNDGSSLILPFDIQNKMAVRMPDVSFRCGVDFVRAVDSAGHQVFIADQAFLNGRKTVVSTATFDCDAHDLLRVRPDGTLSMRGSATEMQSRQRIIYKPPWQVIKMCLWVGGTYRFMGLFSTEFTSQIFQWPAKPGSHQWRAGPFIGERPQEEIDEENRMGLIPGALACSDEVRLPYGLVVGSGMELLVMPAMPTGTLGIEPLPPTL